MKWRSLPAAAVSHNLWSWSREGRVIVRSIAVLIRFQKGKDKPDVLTCVRDDGSQTWTRLQPGFGAQHDLAHYAVETTLGFDGAFYGLLAAGRAIEDFAETEDRRWMGEEALKTEAVVMALQYELAGTSDPEAFLDVVETSCRGQGTGVPSGLTPEAVATMRQRLMELWLRWRTLPPGEVLELEFPARQPA